MREKKRKRDSFWFYKLTFNDATQIKCMCRRRIISAAFVRPQHIYIAFLAIYYIQLLHSSKAKSKVISGGSGCWLCGGTKMAGVSLSPSLSLAAIASRGMEFDITSPAAVAVTVGISSCLSPIQLSPPPLLLRCARLLLISSYPSRAHQYLSKS